MYGFKFNSKKGFTLMELVVSILVCSMMVIILGSIFISANNQIKRNNDSINTTNEVSSLIVLVRRFASKEGDLSLRKDSNNKYTLSGDINKMVITKKGNSVFIGDKILIEKIDSISFTSIESRGSLLMEVDYMGKTVRVLI